MILSLLLQAAASAAPTPAVPNSDIVVVGRRYRDELAACLARNCPPAQEVEAAMRAATETFRAGEYKGATEMLWRTVGRNKRYAAQMPGKMSDLYATYADVSFQEGDENTYRSATRASVDVLRQNLGPNHPATLAVVTRIGDMMRASGRMAEADASYREKATSALAAGNRGLAAMLTYRRATLAFAGKNTTDTLRLLDQMDRQFGDVAQTRAAVAILRAQVALAQGKGSIESLAATARALGSTTPILISSPPFPNMARRETNQGFFSDGAFDTFGFNRGGSSDDQHYRYADIEFWVRPDGSVAEQKIIQSRGGERWAEPILQQIAARRYAALAADPGSPGVYRLERYTLRAAYARTTETRTLQRSGEPVLKMVDLTMVPQRTASAK